MHVIFAHVNALVVEAELLEAEVAAVAALSSDVFAPTADCYAAVVLPVVLPTLVCTAPALVEVLPSWLSTFPALAVVFP